MSRTDDRDEQGAGNEDSFTTSLLRTTSWGGHRPGAFERVLYQVYEALRPLIADRLSEEHACLFAEPVTDPKTGQVQWYAPVAGEAIAYADLNPEDQAAVDVRLNKLLFDLLELSRRMQARAKTLEEHVAGQLLQVQLDAAYTEKQCLYVVGYQPVVAFWAFESGFAPNQFVSSPHAKAPAPAAAAPRSAPAAAAVDEDDQRAEEFKETQWTPALAVEGQPEAARPLPARAPREPWSPRSFGILAVALAVTFFGTFGFSPRATVIDWLDRVQALRAREQALLRLIARSEHARTQGVSAAELDAEVAALGPEKEIASPEDEVDEGFYEPAPEPVPPFDSAKGELTMDKIPGAVVILHFWNNADDKGCAEITSFASMVGTDSFETLREQGAEAYLVTTAESVDTGNELLRKCGVQDPFLLRDPNGRILNRLSPGTKVPATLVYDKEDERALAIYPRRRWTETAAFEDLRKLFLMRVF